MKKYKNGLILGKFYPLHKGHCFLIESAIKKCENLTVLVCSIENETIDGELRYEWMKEIFPDVNVKHITDNSPIRLNDLSTEFKDSTDEFFWNVWIDIIRHNMKNIDVVFTSEQYGFELVEKLNEADFKFKINHEIVDEARKLYPVSGTTIRKNPFENWNFIPNVVKPYFAKKVALVGPESTGKTELAKKLADYYDTTYAKEYGREYTEKFYMGLDTQEFTLEDISNIASGHLIREYEELKNCNKIFITDTETITTQIWSELYFGKSPKWLQDINKIHPYEYDMYFLLDIDAPWVDDGARYMEAEDLRKKHFEMLRNELVRKKIPFAIVNGNYDERFKKIIYGINHFVLPKIFKK